MMLVFSISDRWPPHVQKKPLIHYVKEVFQKLGGLLLEGDEGKKLNILTKCSQGENYIEHRLKPNFDVSLNDE